MTLNDEDRTEILQMIRREITGSGSSSSGREPDVPLGDSRLVGVGPPTSSVALVHSLSASVALGAFTCSFLFDLASHVAPEPYTYPRSAYWLTVVGLLVSFVSAVTGTVEHRRLAEGSSEEHQSGRHMAVALSGTAGYLVAFVWRRGTDFLGEVPLPVVGISALALALIWWAMLSGHRLVPRATMVRREPETDGFDRDVTPGASDPGETDGATLPG